MLESEDIQECACKGPWLAEIQESCLSRDVEPELTLERDIDPSVPYEALQCFCSNLHPFRIHSTPLKSNIPGLNPSWKAWERAPLINLLAMGEGGSQFCPQDSCQKGNYVRMCSQSQCLG